ncbi:MAG: hypothetical protein WCO56_26755 [Verrucomicrobiota bacterium]
MKTHLELLKALAPVIKNQSKAKHLLEKYWQDKIALVWTTQQVHRAANEIETVLTEAEAIEILQDLYQHHNPQYGLRWSDLTDYIKDSDLGRTLTKAELNRFVYHDQITIRR